MQVKEYLKHGVIQNAVNVPSVSHDEYVQMKPYIVLAERLGSFLAQISGSGVEDISIAYTGHITEWKTELIRNAAIKGILNVAVDETRLAYVQVRYSGYIEKVFVDATYQYVRK